MKQYDLPPLWLTAALALSWWLGKTRPLGLSFGGAWADFLGGVLIGGGLVLMVLAVSEMRKRRTTLMPHGEAAQLVTSGIYKRSRNPIYLGDVMVLAGAALAWNAPLALPLVPIFLWMLERRFVIPEEARLRRQFRQDFFRYTQKTRRWI